MPICNYTYDKLKYNFNNWLRTGHSIITAITPGLAIRRTVCIPVLACDWPAGMHILHIFLDMHAYIIDHRI